MTPDPEPLSLVLADDDPTYASLLKLSPEGTPA